MTAPTKPTKPTRRAPASATAPDPAAPAGGCRAASASRSAPAEPNPLREGLRLERMPDPCMLVLFGATGDLSHRKLVPALFQLWRSNLLPVRVPARRGRAPPLRRPDVPDGDARVGRGALAREADRRGGLDGVRQADLVRAARLRPTPTDFDRLAKRLEEIDAESGTHGNMLFYLATQESAFPIIVGQLGRVGLDHETHEGGWRRVVIEKPFGHDLESAIRLNREVGKVFRESQVFRIDHYLGKETVRNLLVFRFGNGIFEPIWNRRYVDHVQITVAESHRGSTAAASSTRRPGRRATCSRTTCSSSLTLVAMEPPATFSSRGAARREGQGAAGDRPDDPRRGGAERRARPVRHGLDRRAGGPGLSRGGRGGPRLGDRDVRRRPPRDRRLALGGRPVLPAHRQAAAEARDRDRDPVPAGPPPAVRRRRRPTPTRTCSRCGSSPTRASCCGSSRRCRASGSTSAP